MQSVGYALSCEDYAVPALFVAALAHLESVFGERCVHLVQALVDYAGYQQGRVRLHEAAEQRTHADDNVRHDVGAYHVVARAELSAKFRVINYVAAVS